MCVYVLFSFVGRFGVVYLCVVVLVDCGWQVRHLLRAESLRVRHCWRGGGIHGYDFGSCDNVRAFLNGSGTL
jgi:hypothetical protein